MFLVGIFSTHIGILVIWLAYLTGMACYSFGVFGTVNEEVYNFNSHNILEYTNTNYSKIETSKDFFFNDVLTQDIESNFELHITPLKVDFSQLFHLKEIKNYLSNLVLSQFTRSFHFSRPPPMF